MNDNTTAAGVKIIPLAVGPQEPTFTPNFSIDPVVIKLCAIEELLTKILYRLEKMR